MSLKEMVAGDKKVKFEFYRNGELWYKTENGFMFPVPIADTGTGAFNAELPHPIPVRKDAPHTTVLHAHVRGMVKAETPWALDPRRDTGLVLGH